MKYSILSIILAGGITLGLNSCDSNLTQTNPNKQTVDTYWNNLNETNATLNSVYAAFRDQNIFLIPNEAWRTDEGWPGFGRPVPQQIRAYNWYIHDINDSDQYLKLKWNAIYKGIFRCNQTIEGLNKIEGTVDEEQWTLQMAQAKFFRGLFYHYLAISFNNGSVVLVDHTATSLDDMSHELSTAEEVETAYMTDLKYAYDNLPDSWGSDGSNQGRPSKGTAATILGIHYLYKGDYPTAETYFDDVIHNTAYGYKLVTGNDVTKLFTNAEPFNSESILEINYSAKFNSEYSIWDEHNMSNFLSDSNNVLGFFPPAWMAYEYKTEEMDTKDARNMDADGNMHRLPLRAMQMITLVEDNVTMYYGKLTGAKIKLNGWGFAQYKKYTNHDIVTKEAKGRSGKNVIINRLPDVYLMYAECLIQKGDLAEAREYMNAIRSRWGLKKIAPNVTQPDEDLHDYIKDDKFDTKEGLMNQLMYTDRPLELSAEGYEIRWQDLKRWGVLESRFKELAGQTYYLHDFEASTIKGKLVKKKVSSIDRTPNLDENGNPVNNSVVDYEYDKVYENIGIMQEYFPIPSTEIQNNPKVNI